MNKETKKYWTAQKVHIGEKYHDFHRLWLKMVDFGYYIENDKLHTKAAQKDLARINDLRDDLGLEKIYPEYLKP